MLLRVTPVSSSGTESAKAGADWITPASTAEAVTSAVVPVALVRADRMRRRRLPTSLNKDMLCLTISRSLGSNIRGHAKGAALFSHVSYYGHAEAAAPPLELHCRLLREDVTSFSPGED
ncbi:hypothetical protein ABZ990_30350 [Streptomyces sp. NPDC046203]|uniref:hypothetical protein n=1 Tax=Streptomyces sp. NPDC046203 TaxID=3154602 RepID=UPI0034115BBE